ncbi:hypothetical protein CBS101457_002427 [Exobasidium rhododendri]|nr:hypothetical protein CBS101457_002427 [Exobasidium rhododendri]
MSFTSGASRNLLANRGTLGCTSRVGDVKTLSTSAMSFAPLRASSPASASTSRSSRSSSSSSPSPSSSSSPSTSNTAAKTLPTSDSLKYSLPWNRYLQLRKQRRVAGIVTTVPTTFLAALSSGSYFLTQEIDPTNTIAGIDPVYVYALLTLSCTGLGYLIGPTVGSSIWSLFHSKHKKEIESKDQDFYQHISAMRVDPSRQTMQNRLPDHYGEKIGSIEDYRQWLRDQAAFKRKAAHGVSDDEKSM